jgi:2,3-bisphosphoglycerate-independent phosphoglycerate mutase
MSESSVLLLFVDGLGIGPRGPFNPLDGLEDAEPLAIFANEEPEDICNGILVRTDATLGVAGRPQSASGQTTILTGINAPARIGYHKQGFPNAALLEIIREHSIFRQLKTAGVAPITFANTYTEMFFDARPRWVSATTAAVEAADLPFRRVADLKNDNAVYHDFIAGENRFTLYEHFITDKVGHAQDMELARTVLKNLAAFVRAVLEEVDLQRTSVVLTSDHGNIEDLSARNHTLNYVLTLVWGARREAIASRIESLADITPAIVETLTGQSIPAWTTA